MIIAIDAHCSCAPTLTGKMEQNLHINGYTRHFSPYFSVDLSVESFEEQSRITQQVGMIVLSGHVLKNCTRFRIIRLFRMFKKSSVDLNGPPQRLQVCNFFIFIHCCEKVMTIIGNGFCASNPRISYNSASSPFI